jgi:hypothetical protein
MKLSTLIQGAMVVAAALSLASPLGAADRAGGKPITIDVTGAGTASGSGEFTVAWAPVSLDSGKLTYRFSFGLEGTNSLGQHGAAVRGTDTLKGRRGRLVIKSTGRTFGTTGYEVWRGKWSVAGGTGRYAGLKGGGGFVAVITSNFHFSFRYEGLVTR